MVFTKVPDHLSQVPKNIRANAAASGTTVHDNWTDVDLLNLWDAMFHDDSLIETFLNMDPKDALDSRNLFDPIK